MKTLSKTIAAVMVMGMVAFGQSAVAQVEDQTTEQGTEQGTEMQQKQGQGQQPEMVAITVTELPAPVSESIETDYADSEPSKVYKTTDPLSRAVVYEVHFLNPQGVTEKVRFDEKGEELEGDGK